MTRAELPVKVTLPAGDSTDVKELRALVQRAEQGDTKALATIRERFDAVPATWEAFGNLASHAQRAWIALAAGNNPLVDEAVRKTSDQLRAELLGDAWSPLERLLVDRIVACWAQVQHADHQAAHFERSGGRFAQGEYWRRQQDRAQRRYLSAIRTLAQVRRLLIPAVQVNIAEQQVNVVQ